ncbi:uncharacterized protein LOC100251942 isoform X2 [Vitis vinifera]|uniref:uncharacterized protein LOC100251942 isoform X2 n=1 Tax=Vitis vinifera TaxID=29760 RepID=UPI00053FC093|nr:uncharacterized protein LOC100251942 isoform X2 [Vitis vinifera]|eukprot:XP_010663267.1 PREDICTED: uncharacterized protein LOC100251942 isoform X2 [Vitis vinifera]
METLDSTSSCSSSASNLQSPSSKTPQPPPSVIRLWRPAAQRNLRNQWSKLASYRQQWTSTASKGRSHATDLVNAYLSLRYMPAMELGVLSDMPNIRKKACMKLLKQQVAVVTHMVNTSRSMRCFLKGTSSSPLVQFSSLSEDTNDLGDGGGTPAFLFWPISSFEKLAEELVQMFILELNLKRLLVVELLSISCEEAPQDDRYCWSDELYPGEFDDLGICSLHSKEIGELIPPKIIGFESHSPVIRSNQQPDHEILQVYLTTWLAEVNIDTHRVDEIFAVIGEEMHVGLP